MPTRLSLFLITLSFSLLACGRTPEEPGGGSGGVSGTGGQVCLTSPMIFELKRPAGSTTNWCLGAPQSCSISLEWLQVKDASGEVVIRSNACGTPCDTCQPMGCPAMCAMPQPLAGEGATQSWDGTFYAQSTCGSSKMACGARKCAAPGRYTAVMCAFVGTTPDAGSACMDFTDPPQTCVEVPFDYPAAATTVTGTLPQ